MHVSQHQAGMGGTHFVVRVYPMDADYHRIFAVVFMFPREDISVQYGAKGRNPNPQKNKRLYRAVFTEFLSPGQKS